MKINDLKKLLIKNEVYTEVYHNIQNKDYISEDVLISEEAESLKEKYLYIIKNTKSKDATKKIYFLEKCILRKYSTFNEVLEKIRNIQKLYNLTTKSEISLKAIELEDFKYTKLQIFNEALDFLFLEKSC